MCNKMYMSQNEIVKMVENIYLHLTDNKIIIITGSKGSGKSYLLNKVKDKLITENKTFAGIETKAQRDKEIYPKAILLYNIGSNVRAGDFGGNKPPQAQTDIEVVVATRNENGVGLIPHTEVFNTIGVKLLKDATNMDIVIIDEIGFIEETAEDYKIALRATINTKASIIVLAKRDTLFIKELLQLQNTVIFDLDEEVESLS